MSSLYVRAGLQRSTRAGRNQRRRNFRFRQQPPKTKINALWIKLFFFLSHPAHSLVISENLELSHSSWIERIWKNFERWKFRGYQLEKNDRSYASGNIGGMEIARYLLHSLFWTLEILFFMATVPAKVSIVKFRPLVTLAFNCRFVYMNGLPRERASSGISFMVDIMSSPRGVWVIQFFPFSFRSRSFLFEIYR